MFSGIAVIERKEDAMLKINNQENLIMLFFILTILCLVVFVVIDRNFIDIIYLGIMMCNDDNSEKYTEIKTALETLEYDPELLASDEYLESEIEGKKEIYKPILISEDISSANRLATVIQMAFANETVYNEFPEGEQRFLLTSYDDLRDRFSESFADSIKSYLGPRDRKSFKEYELPKIKYTYEGASYFGVECNITENNLKVYICDGMDDSGEFINPLEAYPDVSDELTDD